MIRNRLAGTLAIVAVAGALAGCTDSAATKHELACVGGTMGGMVLGGAIGNRFGGGGGQALFTGAGAIAGGVAAKNAMKC